MKQNITPEQLNELPDKGKEALRAWWKPAEHDLYLDGIDINTWYQDADGCIYFNDELKSTAPGGTDKPDWNKVYPLLSIGQMIEFLKTNGSFWWRLQENEVNVFVGETPKDYEGSYTYYLNGNQHNGFSVCDALWSAVKEVLEEE